MTDNEMNANTAKPRENVLTLSQVITGMVDAGEGENVSGDELLAAFGARAYGPLILIPSLLLVSPLSAIPGFSSVMGMCIALLAGQLVLGRERPWLPGFILRGSVPRRRLVAAAPILCRVAKWVDALIRPRLHALTREPLRRVLGLACLGIGLVIPLMEVVPMASSTAGAATAVLALALTARDGLLAIFALLPAAAVMTAVFGVAG